MVSFGQLLLVLLLLAVGVGIGAVLGVLWVRSRPRQDEPEFAQLQQLVTPRCGWTKTIRLALGMSSKALGLRLKISSQGVRKLEMAEAENTITLKTLARLANGLDCELQYILIPRTSLTKQAVKVTQEHMRRKTPVLPQATE